MTGNAVGTISLQARADGATSWFIVCTMASAQGTPQRNGIAASSTKTEQVILVLDTKSYWQGDIAIDDLRTTATSGSADNSANTYVLDDHVVYQNTLYKRMDPS